MMVVAGGMLIGVSLESWLRKIRVIDTVVAVRSLHVNDDRQNVMHRDPQWLNEQIEKYKAESPRAP